MRTPLLIVSFLFVSAIIPGIAAAHESKPDFVAWALDRAGDMDLRWNHMTALGETQPSGTRDGTGTAADFTLSSARIVRGTQLQHSIITSRSFLRTVSTKSVYLPLSTRDRNGASRGVSSLQSPASARLSIPYSVRRPLNSSIQQKNFIRTFDTSVSRPKLDSFGWIHKTVHSYGRAVSRPASRAARPRIL